LPFGKTSFAWILCRIINPILALVPKPYSNCAFDSCNSIRIYIYLTKSGVIILFFSDFNFMLNHFLNLCLIEIKRLFDGNKFD